MISHYIEKMISLDLEAMNINELLNYLEFLQEHQFYFDRRTATYPFRKKHPEVVQFIVKKYGALDIKEIE